MSHAVKLMYACLPRQACGASHSDAATAEGGEDKGNSPQKNTKKTKIWINMTLAGPGGMYVKSGIIARRA